MHGDYTVLKALRDFFNEAKTTQIFLVNGRHKYMVLCYDAETDYNHNGLTTSTTAIANFKLWRKMKK